MVIESLIPSGHAVSAWVGLVLPVYKTWMIVPCLRVCSLGSCCQPSPPTIDATRRRAFALVSQAYTSIVADDFAAFVGLPVEEAVKGTWSLVT